MRSKNEHKIFRTPHTVNVIEVMLVLLRIPRIYEVVTATISGSKLDRLRRKSGQEEGLLVMPRSELRCNFHYSISSHNKICHYKTKCFLT